MGWGQRPKWGRGGGDTDRLAHVSHVVLDEPVDAGTRDRVSEPCSCYRAVVRHLPAVLGCSSREATRGTRGYVDAKTGREPTAYLVLTASTVPSPVLAVRLGNSTTETKLWTVKLCVGHVAQREKHAFCFAQSGVSKYAQVAMSKYRDTRRRLEAIR